MHRVIGAIRIVRPYSIDRVDLQAVAVVELAGAAGVRDRVADAGDGARRAAVIAAEAATVPSEGGLLVVDPLDVGIHPLWCRQLIDTFAGQPAEHSNRGQLFFTMNNRGGLLGSAS